MADPTTPRVYKNVELKHTSPGSTKYYDYNFSAVIGKTKNGEDIVLSANEDSFFGAVVGTVDHLEFHENKPFILLKNRKEIPGGTIKTTGDGRIHPEDVAQIIKLRNELYPEAKDQLLDPNALLKTADGKVLNPDNNKLETAAAPQSPAKPAGENAKPLVPQTTRSLEDQEDLNSKLLGAVWNHDIAAVQQRLSEGAEVNAQDYPNSKNTPLHYAAHRVDKKIAEILVKKGASVNAEDKNRSTPLHEIAENITENVNDQLLITKLLLDNGAKIDAQDVDGCTALHYAAKYGNTKMIKLLLDYRADPTLKSKPDIFFDKKEAMTAREVALESHAPDNAKLLQAAEDKKAGKKIEPSYTLPDKPTTALMDKLAILEAAKSSGASPENIRRAEKAVAEEAKKAKNEQVSATPTERVMSVRDVIKEVDEALENLQKPGGTENPSPPKPSPTGWDGVKKAFSEPEKLVSNPGALIGLGIGAVLGLFGGGEGSIVRTILTVLTLGLVGGAVGAAAHGAMGGGGEVKPEGPEKPNVPQAAVTQVQAAPSPGKLPPKPLQDQSKGNVRT